jgi:hypothetical protein
MSLRVFLEVKRCSKAIFVLGSVHGESPCFSRCSVLAVVGVSVLRLPVCYHRTGGAVSMLGALMQN